MRDQRGRGAKGEFALRHEIGSGRRAGLGEQVIGVDRAIEIAAAEPQRLVADRGIGIDQAGTEILMRQAGAVGEAQPRHRCDGGAPDDVGDIIVQPAIDRIDQRFVKCVGLADQPGGVGTIRQVPRPLQRVIDARAAGEPIDPAEALQAEQIGVGELEIEAVFVRDHLVLGDAIIGRDFELHPRLDDLFAPIARAAFERPACRDRRDRDGAGGFGRADV